MLTKDCHVLGASTFAKANSVKELFIASMSALLTLLNNQQPSKMPTTTSGLPTGFLDLPLALRHQIYRYALRTDDDIEVDGTTNIRQPALLQAHPVIRQEAAPMYYYMNSFNIDMPDFDPSTAIAFHNHTPIFISLFFVDCDFDFGFRPSSWENLLRWIEAYYEAQTNPINQTPMPRPRHMGRHEWLAGKAFDMADMLMNHVTVDWDEIKTVLEEWKSTTEEIVTWT